MWFNQLLDRAEPQGDCWLVQMSPAAYQVDWPGPAAPAFWFPLSGGDLCLCSDLSRAQPALLTFSILPTWSAGAASSALPLVSKAGPKALGRWVGIITDSRSLFQTNLSADYNGSAVEYTCFQPKSKRWEVGLKVMQPVQDCVDLPEDYYVSLPEV